MTATFYVIASLPDGRVKASAYARRGTSTHPNTAADVLASEIFDSHAEADAWRF